MELLLYDPVEAIMTNALIPPSPGEEPKRGWISISSGIIEDMGKGDPPGHHLPVSSRKIDLHGSMITPAFYDAHMHLFQWSISRKAVDLSSAGSRRQMFDILKRSINEQNPILLSTGLLFGVDYDESRFTGKRSITRKDLDGEFPLTPVFLRRICGHKAILNSAAFDLIDVERTESGILLEEYAMDASWKIRFPKESMNDILQDGVNEMRSLGVIGGTDILPRSIVMDALSIYGNMDNPPRISLSVQFAGEMDMEGPFKNVEDPYGKNISLKQTPEPRVLFSKHFMDGSIGARTASFSDDYLDHKKVDPILSKQRIRELMENSRDRGLVPMVHSIGDRATTTLLDAHEGSGISLRMEHLESIRNPQRLCSNLIHPCVQPNFQANWGGIGGLYDQALGNGRFGLNDISTLIHHNDRTAFGSDMMPPGPIYGIRAATRHPNVDSSITLGQAIDSYSMKANAISFPGFPSRNGIVIGSPADLCVFREDMPGATYVIVSGKVIHASSNQ